MTAYPKALHKPKRTSTAPTATMIADLTVRDGHRCADCGADNETLVPHHRANRGMGGRRSLNRLSNLVWLCATDNDRLESNAAQAIVGRGRGLKIGSNDEPSHAPILHAVHGYCLLDDDGGVHTGPEVF